MVVRVWDVGKSVMESFPLRFLWKVNCYGKLSGLNPKKRRSETLIAFHNTLPCSDAINLSGTVNLPGRRVGGKPSDCAQTAKRCASRE